jgi:fatty acid desaturase
MITIEGVTYDISAFRHPGGAVIHAFQGGVDATDMFLALHPPNSRARKTLDTLPVISRKPTTILSPYHQLHSRVMEIVNGPTYAARVNDWMLRQMMLGVGLTMLWITLLLLHSRVFSCVAYSVTMLHVGWLAHHAIHRQFGPCYCPWLVDLATGYSSAWWHQKHNVLHHSHTNVLGHDTDIQDGIFAFDMSQPSIPYQHVFFWPILSVLRILWCVNGARSVFAVLHHGVVGGLLLSEYPPIAAGAWYLAGNLFSGFMMGFVVVQSHNAETVVREQGVDHLAHTAMTTRNMPTGLLNDFFSGYLNYQIEHHLFPWLPCVFFADIQPLVKATLAEHNLPYTQMTWTDSVVKLYRHMRSVKMH